MSVPIYELLTYLFSIIILVGLWSFLWKDNLLFRFFQYSYLAVATAGYAIMSWDYVYKSVIIPVIKGNFIPLIPLFISLLLFGSLSTKYTWISRYATSFILGVSLTLMMRGITETGIVNMMTSIFSFAKIGKTWGITMNNIIKISAAVFTIIYFFFHFVHRYNIGRGMQRIGRYFIMVGFGTQFGTGIMTSALFIAWIVQYVTITGPPAGYQWFSIVALLIAVGILLLLEKKS
jgi:hypothetical protein